MTSLTIPRSSGTSEAKALTNPNPTGRGFRKGDIWTPAMEESLRAYWAGGGSAAKIAKSMSEKFGLSLSRCAILGKRQRMGLSTRDLGRKPSGARAPYVRKPRPERRTVAKRGASILKLTPKPIPVVKQVWVAMPYPEPLRVHFIDRTRLQCSRPLWPNKPKPTIAQMFVCGNPVEEDAKFEFCPACASNLLVPPRAGLKPFKNERIAA